MLRDSHTAPHLITGAREGGQRQIWWPCSSGGCTPVSRTSDRGCVYGAQHNEWSKVWFKWASPDPSNCSPVSVITTLCALYLGLHTGSSEQGSSLKHFPVYVWLLSFLFSIKWQDLIQQHLPYSSSNPLWAELVHGSQCTFVIVSKLLVSAWWKHLSIMMLTLITCYHFHNLLPESSLFIKQTNKRYITRA